MSKTNSENREVRESRELTNDELELVVGGTRKATLQDAKLLFAHGDIQGGMQALAAAQGK